MSGPAMTKTSFAMASQMADDRQDGAGDDGDARCR